ncbi:unnamed protein product [Cuscuta europaea]|uniref:GRF-type domain-containing protein n=1 Tax=Cuscuta europaea TaxID=41803 RepID=A0A9P1DZY6_CUSEU|nr:unnamed protein product [Cuscuta europaea]
MAHGICACGIPLKMLTSWTDDNPGRRFLTCSTLKGNGGCKMFEWVDPEMCPRSKMIIPGLLRKINKLQVELEEKNAMPKKKKKWTVLWCVMGGMLLLGSWIVCFDIGSKNKLAWDYCEAPMI